jgi:uncharacterized protein (DUF1697 family)
MPIYVAMLRGINVSGHNPVKMELLRKSFEKLKCTRVRTYVQSGNVVFDAPATPITRLQEKIEKQIQRDFAISVPVVLRTSKELAAIIRRNPFPADPAIDRSKLHVTFLAEPCPESKSQSLNSLAAPAERFQVSGSEVFLYCPNGYGNSKLSNTAVEKKLGIRATTRNWKTVNALAQLAQ